MDRRYPRRVPTSQHCCPQPRRTSHLQPKPNAQTPYLLATTSPRSRPRPQSILRRCILRRRRPPLRRPRNRDRSSNASDPFIHCRPPISNTRHNASAPERSASTAPHHRTHRSGLLIRGITRRANESGERHDVHQPTRRQSELEARNGRSWWPEKWTGQSRCTEQERSETAAAATTAAEGYALEFEPGFRTAGR